MQNAQTADAGVTKIAPPLVSSAAGKDEDSNQVGLTLFANQDKSKENAPDLTGYYTRKGKKHYVSGWLVPAGEHDGKPYGAFLTLRETVRNGDKFDTIGTGAAQGMNTYHGKPVDENHRSVLIANFKVNGETFTATGYANDGLVDNPGLAAALGFTGPVVAKAKTGEAEAEPEQKPASRRKP